MLYFNELGSFVVSERSFYISDMEAEGGIVLEYQFVFILYSYIQL